jgi:CHAT domain-containing protein/tetratricopeptide (TPR) repeat protein
MNTRRSRRWIAHAFIVCLASAAPALAQDPTHLFREAEALCEKGENVLALGVLERIPDTAASQLVVLKYTTIIEVLSSLNRLAEIPPLLARARTLAETADDAAAMARVETAEGLLLRVTHRGDHGLSAYHRAAELAVKAQDPKLLSRIYHQLADAYNGVENWERFTYYKNEAFRLLPNPSLNARFNHAIAIGISDFQAYDRDAAEAQFKTAFALAVESKSKVNESFALGELAYVYWTFDRDTPRAIEHYTRAIDLAVEVQALSMEASWRVHRGNVWRAAGQYDRALADFKRALALWEASGSGDRFGATKHLGHTYRLMGHLEEARAVLEPLVTTRPFNPTPRHLWAAQMELASTYEALGDRQRAGEQYRAMLDVLEEQRNTSILDTFRSGSFAHSLTAYDPYERYMRFLTTGADARDGTEALRISEQARARSFLEMLASVRSAVAANVPAPLLEEEARIMRGISDVQSQLRAADPPRAEHDRLLADLARLERERDAFRLKLRVEHPSLAEARYPSLASARELQDALRPRETAVSFFLGEPDSFRWTVSRDGITFQRLPGRRAIEAQAGRLRAQLRAPGDVAAVHTEAGALASLLLEGLRLDAGSAVVVVPHGILNYVPFEVLPVGGSMLIEGHSVTYAPSLNALAHLRNAPPNAARFRVLAIGNPALDSDGGRVVASRTGDVENLGLLGSLPFAEEELAAIGRTFAGRAEILSGLAARESAFRAADFGNFPVIHFATHGVVAEAHASRSGLVFSPEANEDGLLQTPEIYRLGLKAELVVLSACETALGREITGEGIMGLTRAFFYAGSRAVVAALWSVNDRFSAEFAERFYREIRSRRSTDEALRRAKLAFITHPQFAHPFYWSSLVLIGDGGRVLYTDTNSPTTVWTGAGIAALIILAVAVGAGDRYRRRRDANDFDH